MKLRIPADVAVEFTSTAFLGGIKFFNEGAGGIFASKSFHYPGEPSTRKKLFIKGQTLMGGIDLKD